MDITSTTSESLVSFSTSSTPERVSKTEKLLLFMDGSMTLALSILTESPISIELIEEKRFQNEDELMEFKFPLIRKGTISAPYIQRKVYLKTKSENKILFAVSLWNEQDYHKFLEDKKKAIGTSLSERKVEYFRDITSTGIISNPKNKELTDIINEGTNEFLCRGYFMYTGGKALTYIEEYLLPDLQKYI